MVKPAPNSLPAQCASAPEQRTSRHTRSGALRDGTWQMNEMHLAPYSFRRSGGDQRFGPRAFPASECFIHLREHVFTREISHDKQE